MFLIISRFLHNFMKPTNKTSLGRWSLLECDKMLERRIYIKNKYCINIPPLKLNKFPFLFL